MSFVAKNKIICVCATKSKRKRPENIDESVFSGLFLDR